MGVIQNHLMTNMFSVKTMLIFSLALLVVVHARDWQPREGLMDKFNPSGEGHRKRPNGGGGHGGGGHGGGGHGGGGHGGGGKEKKKEKSFFTRLACENVVMMKNHFLSLSREKNAQQIYQTARA